MNHDRQHQAARLRGLALTIERGDRVLFQREQALLDRECTPAVAAELILILTQAEHLLAQRLREKADELERG